MNHSPQAATEPARTPPPALDPTPPDCPICDEPVEVEPDSFTCQRCQCSWDDVCEPGEWLNGEQPQCQSTIQPFIASRYVHVPEHLRNVEYRCLLDLDHDGNHDSPDYRPWDDSEATK